jgi:hypothetical protein
MCGQHSVQLQLNNTWTGWVVVQLALLPLFYGLVLQHAWGAIHATPPWRTDLPPLLPWMHDWPHTHTHTHTQMAGTPGTPGSADGPATSATINGPLWGVMGNDELFFTTKDHK